jgi:trehalose synthase
MDEVPITAQPVHRFAEVLGEDRVARFAETLELTGRRLVGHTLWHVNSTAEGGGVAEMLQSILGYPLGSGVPVRWLVIDGNEAFFELTKRLHHWLHGSVGDDGPLGEAERQVYESALAADGERLARKLVPGDPVILHDPQTLGLAPRLAAAGARIIWSCHIGADTANDRTRAAWQFLAPYAAHTAFQVFSRAQYRWDVLDPARVVVIPPCIDAFSPKNQTLDEAAVAAILDAAGVARTGRGAGPATFVRSDGTSGGIGARAELIEDAPIPAAARIATQISRWDPLKDHIGVLTAFAEHVAPDVDAHLVLAGPAPESITDDPEGQQTLDEVRSAWSALPPDRRQRVHLACLPMSDLEENAAIVNALQRRSDVVIQKSLAEGFGLTVAEAMWKARATVGSRVGGIQDQIEPDVSGLLVEPDDLAQFGAAVTSLLRDPETARALGRAARARVCGEYLAPRHLDRYFQLVAALS